MITECGLYILSDQYFAEFPSEYLVRNKHEKRPYYVAIKKTNGIIWLVPLSSQVSNYQAKIVNDENKFGPGNCIRFYITKFKGADSVFLIGNAIPVTEDYLVRPFTISGKPFVIQDKEDIKQIRSKLSRFLTLVRTERYHPNVDILSIEKTLLEKL